MRCSGPAVLRGTLCASKDSFHKAFCGTSNPTEPDFNDLPRYLNDLEDTSMPLFESKDEEYARGVKDGQNAKGLVGMLGDIIPGPETYGKGWEYGRRHPTDSSDEDTSSEEASSDYSEYSSSSGNYGESSTAHKSDSGKTDSSSGENKQSIGMSLLKGLGYVVLAAVVLGALSQGDKKK
mgnify:CR=1 FL=1